MPRKPRRPPHARGSVLDSIYPTLDLHGDTADGARTRASRWLRARSEAGERTVRIITGRGLHSSGPPVLPGEIALLLDQLKSSIVRSFEAEPGGGVLRVELRGPDPRAARAGRLTRGRSLPAPADPALRRAAEESLAELGIDPTPELVEAEMKRLKIAD